MWKMIKADIAYNRALFIILYAFIFVVFARNCIWGGHEESSSILMFFSVMVIGIVAGVEEIKTKRIRFFSVLPVSSRKLGMLRYPTFIAYWLSLMVLLWLGSLISRRGHLGLNYLWWNLTRTGAMFLWIASMDLSQDLPSCVRKRGSGYILKWMVLLFGTFGGPFLYFVTNSLQYTDPFFVIISETFTTPTGALALFFFGLSLMFLSVFVYERRRSFIE